MSALGGAARVAHPEPVRRPAPQRYAEVRALPPRPRQVVATVAPGRAGLGAFMGLLVGVLASGLFGLLLLNTTLGEGSFRIRAMQLAVSQLSDQAQQLQQQVALAESPAALQQRAVALGMVPSSSPVFLRLSDGKVLGVPVPAVAAPVPIAPSPVPATGPRAAAKPTAPKTVSPPPTKPTAGTVRTTAKPITVAAKANPKH